MLAAGADEPVRDWSAYPMEPGLFDGTWESLDRYEYPEWFRDAKYESLYHPPFTESARYPQHPPEAWKREWYVRVKDLIDQYRPDLMYFGTKYKAPSHVIQMLIDIVSKNGNLLLNLPLHPDGYLDEDEIAFLKAMGDWMKVNGEGLYGTRPWVIYGEGLRKSGGGAFNESASQYTARDFRYTAKGDSTLYAFFMNWPTDGQLRLRALAKTPESGGVIENVELLGHAGPLQFKHSAEGLAVTLPATRPCEHAWALRITGESLRSFAPQEFVYAVQPDDRGHFVLNAEDAQIHGKSPRLERKPSASKSNIGYWDSANDWVSWQVQWSAAASRRFRYRMGTWPAGVKRMGNDRRARERSTTITDCQTRNATRAEIGIGEIIAGSSECRVLTLGWSCNQNRVDDTRGFAVQWRLMLSHNESG